METAILHIKHFWHVLHPVSRKRELIAVTGLLVLATFSLAGCAGGSMENLPGTELLDKIKTTTRAHIEKYKTQVTSTSPGTLAIHGDKVSAQTADTKPAAPRSRVKYYDAIHFSGDPIENYIRIGRLVQQCWLKSNVPSLKKLVYYAEADRTKYGPQALISLHFAAELGRKGRVTFLMKLEGNGQTTTLSPANYKLDLVIADQMDADMRRWSQLDTHCRPFTLPLPAAEKAPLATPTNKTAAQIKLPIANPGRKSHSRHKKQ